MRRTPFRSLSVILLSLSIPAALSAYDPVAGSELLDRLRSPLFLATGGSTVTDESVAGDVLNPAVSALKQRVHLDLGYISVVGDGAISGHATALGVAVPTRVGVFTGSLDGAFVSEDDLALGNRGSLSFSFAKDLYPSLLVGAGLRGHLSDASGSVGFGGGLDLGIVHILDPPDFLADLRWGLALRTLGIGAPGPSGTTTTPSPFTPSADIAATVVDTDTVTWSLSTGFTAPTVQNVVYRAATELTLFDRIGLAVGWDVNLADRLSNEPRDSLLPAVALTVRLQTDIRSAGGIIDEQGWGRSDIAIHGAWAPLTDGLWAAGAGINAALGVVDRVPPEITLEEPETIYISPNNDGAADDFLLPVAIEDERFVVSWTLDISDESGALVRRIENKEPRPEAAGFQNVIDRLLYVERGVEIPEAVRWDGRTDDGGVAEDGTYRYTLTAVDDNGNTRVTEPAEVVVDATEPAITVVEPEDPDELIFSPNDDGNKDVLTIDQQSSEEDEWLVEILDAEDTPVFSTTFESQALEAFTWDGRDNSGALVPDGVYTYRAQATDRALNVNSATLANIIVDTAPTPIGIAVDLGYFSPDGDGAQDEVTVTPEIPVRNGIRVHRFTVIDEAGTARRTIEGGSEVPATVTIDGRDDAGRILPEGSYRVVLSLEYRNGNQPSATSPTIVLDVTDPRVSVTTDTAVFSPNGDGRLDNAVLLQDTEDVPRWEARMETAAGTVVRRWSWTGRPPLRLEWDGRSDAGEPVADGFYRYVLTGTDRAGNTRAGSPVRIELDTRETPLFVAPSREAFSPNGDGVFDRIEIISEVADPRGAERFTLEVLDSADRVVARFDGSEAPPERFEWDGRGTDGRTLVDGAYRARVTIEYRHGNRPQAAGAPFAIDTIAPRATVRAGDSVFSPDGDGSQDSIAITQSSSEEAAWNARIVSLPTGRTVRGWTFPGRLSTFDWDGTDDQGEVVSDGSYRYEVDTVDAAGNRVAALTESFRIDTREVEVRLRISEAAFSPNGDGVLDTVLFEPSTTADVSVAEWTLAILDEDDDAVLTRNGTGALEPFSWNGSTGAGRAPDGTYRGRLSVAFERGDSATVFAPRPVVLDTVAPRVDVTLSSDIVSPNGDGRLDTLSISIDASQEDRWVATVSGPTGTVRRWEWAGTPPAELDYTGTDDARRRVADGSYTLSVSAVDAAGNRGSGELPFEIYSAETPLELFAARAAFSPNGDGAADTVGFNTRTGEARGLERYTFTIEDASGTAVVTRTGASLPARFSWDGRAGNAAPVEGTYRARLVLEYRHGNRPEAQSEPVVLDVTAPALSVGAQYEIFSPDGDGNRDSVRITQSSGVADGWSARIESTAGTTVRSYSWSRSVESFAWDGTDEAGNVVADGDYRYVIAGGDAAGNRSQATVAPLTVDTRGARLFVTVDRRTLSPNDDGVDDSLSIGAITSRTDGADSRTVEVVDSNGRVVRSFASDTVRARETISWNGRDENGRVVDGAYSVRYRVSYDNGARPETVSPTVTLDTAGPAATVRLEGLPFSPDNDGLNDELGIALGVSDATGVAEWTFTILDRNDNVFQTFEGTGQPRRRIIWDGRSASGETVISAEDYPFRFTAIDVTGNRSVETGVIPVDILVVRVGDRLRIQIPNITFQPNSPALQLDNTTEQGRKNVEVLERLVEIFDRYRDYEILIEGHAVNLTGTQAEETQTLQPLSLARATSVRDALVARGMDEDRIDVEGRGGTMPIVPHTDLAERWKNRRVDFYLIR